jgi:hypothetical protein
MAHYIRTKLAPSFADHLVSARIVADLLGGDKTIISRRFPRHSTDPHKVVAQELATELGLGKVTYMASQASGHTFRTER